MYELILLISSDFKLNNMLQQILQKNNYRVKCASSGKDALEFSRSGSYEFIVIDIDLQDINGLDVCIVLKNDIKTRAIPIILLAKPENEQEIVNGMEIGAYDYFIKPINPIIFISKIKSFFGRKTLHNTPGSYSSHNIYLNSLTYEVRINEKSVDLTLTEFKILMYFIKHPGIIFKRNEIVDILHNIKGNSLHIKERSIDVHINNLRKKLGSEGSQIKSIYGIGYRFN